MKKTRSIKWRLVIPFCLILIFQTIFMMAFLSTGNVAQGLYQTELQFIEKGCGKQRASSGAGGAAALDE